MPKKTKKVRVHVYMPQDIRDLAEECASSIGMSLSQFISAATAQRSRNWEHPVTGEKIASEKKARAQEDRRFEGYLCLHGAHGSAIPAAECPKRDSRVHQERMFSEEEMEPFLSP